MPCFAVLFFATEPLPTISHTFLALHALFCLITCRLIVTPHEPAVNFSLFLYMSGRESFCCASAMHIWVRLGSRRWSAHHVTRAGYIRAMHPPLSMIILPLDILIAIFENIEDVRYLWNVRTAGRTFCAVSTPLHSAPCRDYHQRKC